MYLLPCLRFLEYMGKLYAVFPLEGRKKLQNIIYDFVWWFYFINLAIAACMAILTCLRAQNDFMIAAFSWLEFVSEMEAITILINFKYYQNTLKILVIEAEDYLTDAESNPRKLSFLKERANLFAVLMILVTLMYLIVIIADLLNPAVTTWDSLLMTSYYPSSVRSKLADLFLYFHQIVVMFHASVAVNIDAMVVLLIYLCTVRLKVLSKDFEHIKNYNELKECIHEHQFILDLTEKTNQFVRVVASKTVICFVSYTVVAGIQLTHPDATPASLHRFSIVLLLNYVRLIMTTTSADDLTTASKNIGLSIYSSPWYMENKLTTRTKFIIMLRSQKLLRIHMDGILPALSLSYTTGIIYTSISFFTTLRAIAHG